MKTYRRVGLLIETSRAYGRGLLRGVTRYHHEHLHWSIDFTPQGLNEKLPAWLEHWQGDGLLARIDNRRFADAVLRLGVPTIDLRGTFTDLGLAPFGIDNQAIAETVLEHLLDRGLKHFAFYGPPRTTNRSDDLRCDCFCRVVEQAGHTCDLFPHERDKQRVHAAARQRQIADWITSLPKPVGMMACHDDQGREVLSACRAVGAAVPEEVAVIGVDNDEHLCSLSVPPLSSVDLNTERIGHEASVVLDRMMATGSRSHEPVMLPPRRVVTRQSTDMLAIDDTHVSAVVAFIRQHAHRDISLNEIVNQVPLSHSALQRRFRKVFGRSLKAEIIRVRIEHAKHLLIESDLPIKSIAGRSGFKQAKYFIDTFHRKVGVTPLSFRNQFGNRSRGQKGR